MKQSIIVALITATVLFLSGAVRSQTPTEKSTPVTNPSDAASIEAAFVGHYSIKVTGKGTGTSEWMAMPDKTFQEVRDGNRKSWATWKAAGDTIVVTYDNPDFGTAVLKRTGDTTWVGDNKHTNGDVYHWVMTKTDSPVPKEEPQGKKAKEPSTKGEVFSGLGKLPMRPDTQGMIAISPDGKLIASGGWGKETEFLRRAIQPKELHRIYVSDLITGRTLNTLEAHTEPITGLAFSADSSSLFSGSLDGSVREWDMKTGREKRTVIKSVNTGGLGISLNKNEVVTVTKMIPGKSAALDGRLTVGDRITSVSDRDGKMVRV